MKGKRYILVTIVFAIGFLLCSCQIAKASSGTQSLEFKEETTPRYIGSYVLFRTNNGVEWSEFGSWKSDMSMFFDAKKCIKLTYEPYGTFYADANHKWVLTQNFWGESCLELRNK